MSKLIKKPSPTRKMRPGRNGGMLLAEPGPGRPRIKHIKELVQDMDAEGLISARQLIEALYKRAKKRDTAAAKLLIETGWGKHLDITSDGQPVVAVFPVVVKNDDDGLVDFEAMRDGDK